MSHESIWSCPRGCGYHIADGPVPDGDVPIDVLISEHMEEHGPAVVELTDELAKTLAAVVDNTLEYPDDDDNAPAANALVDYERRRARQQKTEQDATLSVLASLGLIHATHDGRWFAELAGREALGAREAAAEAARRRKLVEAWASAVAELHAIADAIGSVPVEGLAELRVEVGVMPSYREQDDAVKVATVDALTAALLPGPAKTERLSGTSDHWWRKAVGIRGPVKVEVSSFVADPTAREREAAEQARVAELERLRAEVERLKAAASDRPQSTIEQAEAASSLSDCPGGAA